MDRLENLGDYNIVRMDLQNAGGRKEVLYKMIGDAAVAKKAPEYLFMGIVIGVTGVSIINAGFKVVKSGITFLKNRKNIIEHESVLKEEFNKIVDSEENVLADEGAVNQDKETDNLGK